MTANTDSRPAPFSRSDYKTLGLAALGGALEIYDFIIFVFFALDLPPEALPADLTRVQLMEKIKGHVLRNSSVVRRYHR